MPDVHDSPDPLSSFVKEGLACETNVIHVYQNLKMFLMQVTPAGFTFAIWGVIFLWQGLWVAYAWSFLCRPNAYHTINTGVYIGFTAVNALNITWLFVWGYLHIVIASGVLFGLNVLFYPTIGLLVGNFYKNSSKSDSLDRTLTWVLPINGLFFYVTWTTIASLINLTVVLEYTTTIGTFTATQSGTVALSLLLVVLVIYFTLENTVLFNVLRYVLSVYPVVIWALVGELSAHWGAAGEERNSQFTLGLLVVTVALFIVRIGRLAGANVFRAHRPRQYETLAAV